VRLPGVTEILSAAGVIDASVYPRGGEYMQRGTDVHTLADMLDQGDEDGVAQVLDLRPDLVPYLDAWRLYLVRSQVEIVEVELPVASATYRYAGRLDRVVRCPAGVPGLAVLDIKTGHAQRWAGPQTAAYAQAYWEMSGQLVVSRRVVELRPDGTFRETQCLSPDDWRVFSSAAYLWHWRAKGADHV
jgi:hypothetical protein